MKINNEDFSRASHEAVVSAIQGSGDLVTMTVCSPLLQPEVMNCSSLPPTPADKGPSRQCVTLPRKLQGRPPQPPRRDPKTTFKRGLAAMNSQSSPKKEPIYESSASKTASIRPRPTSSRISTSEELFQLGPAPVPPVQVPKTPKVYASVSAMKRMKKQKPVENSEDTQLHRMFYSTPDLAWETEFEGSQATLTPALSSGIGSTSPSIIPNGPTSLPPDWRRSQSHESVTNVHSMNIKKNRHSWAFSVHQRLQVDKQYNYAWKDLEQSHTEGTTSEGSDEDVLTPVNDLSDEPSPASFKSSNDSKCEDNLLGISEYRTVKPCRPVGGTLQRRMPSPVGPPPPTNPPPPVPQSQVVMVDVSKGSNEYASLTVLSPKLDKTEFSSFRPDESKVYASPERLATLKKAGSLAARSRSLPLRTPKPNVQIKNDAMSASYTEDQMNNGKQTSVYDLPVKPEREPPFIPEPDYDSDGCNHFEIKIKQKVLKTPRGESPRQTDLTSPPRVIEEPLKPVSEGRKLFDHRLKEEDMSERNENIYVSFIPVKPTSEKVTNSLDVKCIEETESESSEPTIISQCFDKSSRCEDSSSSASTMSNSSLPSDHIGTIEVPVKFDSDEVSPIKKLSEKDIDSQIEKSLEMIRYHVNSIQEVQTKVVLKGTSSPLPPLPDYDEDTTHSDDFLPPPPPEFCDITSGKSNAAPPLPPPPTLKQLNDNFLRGRPKPKMERRLSEELFRPSARVVGLVPKKVSFSPEVTLCDQKFDKSDIGLNRHRFSVEPSYASSRTDQYYGSALQVNFNRGYYMKKRIQQWSVQDVCDWIDSLSLSEYKASFSSYNVSGDKLVHLTSEDLNQIGVKNLSHRLTIEKSLTRYKKS
ncbi:hypothetical protein QYM36_004140 [Artemia franciscana]|uniref:SAM domain-containing protein n=2 Tax=Artemia franciscana TaxID=6661 RepID=A0AA88L7T3_ARTSF|nr:hypothetical protein QYM36_004140 [Artemia franciscana]